MSGKHFISDKVLWAHPASVNVYQTYSLGRKVTKEWNWPPYNITLRSFGWPQACLFRITSWITAFITFERCLCISLPIKVKDITTPKRAILSVGTIYLAMFLILSPEFFTVDFVPSFNVKQNRTTVGVSFSSNTPGIKSVTASLNVTAQLLSFIAVIICTAILVLNLFANSQKHRKITSLSNSDLMSLRDKRVMKMITCISCIFILCYFPSAVNLILMVHFPDDYSNVGRYQNVYSVTWAVFSTLETVNSSVNIFVYYNMSSKFRSVFNELFCSRPISLFE